MLWSTVAALASAALFAVTTNLQRVAAASVAPGGGPLHLVRRLVTDVRWLAGGVVGIAALGLHGLALVFGGVLVVQSVMALGLLLAIGVEAIRERRPLHAREVGGAALVVTGVAAVVGTGRGAGADEVLSPMVVAACVLVVGVALSAVVRSRHQVGRRWEARLLAAAAGACFAVDAVFLRQVAVPVDVALGSGATPDVVAAAIGFAGFLAAGAVGGVAVHRAYQVAPLSAVQPSLAAAEPLTAFVLGVGLLGEGVRGGTVGFAVLVGGLVAITAGILTGVGGQARGVDGASARGERLVPHRPADRPLAGAGRE